MELVTWLAENWETIGPTGLLVITYILLVYAFIKRTIIFGFYHDEIVKDGEEALKLLPVVNAELQGYKILAAEQKVRDEYGLREKEDAARRLELCMSDLGRCRDRERGQTP